MKRHILYDCGCCGSCHPWNWDGDCREDDNRFDGPEDYAKRKHVKAADVEVRTMEERLEAD